MKCPKCGQALPDGARFCFQCGEPLPQRSTEDMDCFVLFDHAIWVDSKLRDYVDIRQRYVTLADKIARVFSSGFLENFPNIDVFYHYYAKQLSKIADYGVLETVRVLSRYNFVGVNHGLIKRQVMRHFYGTNRAAGPLLLAYEDLQRRYEGGEPASRETDTSLRELAENSNVAEMVADVLTGELQKTIIRTAVEVGGQFTHGVYQAMTAADTTGDLVRAKERLYGLIDVNVLADALRDDIISMHLVPGEVVESLGKPVPYAFTEQRRRAAREVYDDLVGGFIEATSAKSAISRMIQLYPFEADFYRLSIRLFPEEERRLRAFANVMKVTL